MSSSPTNFPPGIKSTDGLWDSRSTQVWMGKQHGEEQEERTTPGMLPMTEEAPPSVPPQPPAWRPPKPGTVIDSYQIMRPLGRGSMGVVMKGRDLRLDRLVAIKFIMPSIAGSEGIGATFEEEAQLMAMVQHENVTGVYAFGYHDETPYFVMEYVDGRDLEATLVERRGRPLILDDALAILDAVCRGVQAVHAAGAAHGDLKPANIILGQANRVVVTDFGAARALRGHHQSGSILGTPAYLAPELGLLASGGDVDSARADVYSLGVLAFELLTGQLPFPTDDVMQMLEAHAYSRPPLVSDVRPELPPEFDLVIAGALEKSPEQRTPSAQRFRQQLNGARRVVPDSEMAWRFVVADDEPMFRMLGETILKSGFPSCEVDAVRDGQAAVQAIIEKKTTLALVDLDMPRLDGRSVVEAVRAHPDGRDVPIIIISAAGGARDRKDLAERGAAAMMSKPVDPDSLLHIVRRLLYGDGV